MHEIALDLLILLAGIWLVAVTLRPLGLPTRAACYVALVRYITVIFDVQNRRAKNWV